MNDVYTYIVPLPHGINEFVAPCVDGGYSVYIDERLDEEQRIKAYRHALNHVERRDFDDADVQMIELKGHL